VRALGAVRCFEQSARPLLLHAKAGWGLRNGSHYFVAPLKRPSPTQKMLGLDASRMAKWLVDVIVDSKIEDTCLVGSVVLADVLLSL
jgi:hypothetical protein